MELRVPDFLCGLSEETSQHVGFRLSSSGQFESLDTRRMRRDWSWNEGEQLGERFPAVLTAQKRDQNGHFHRHLLWTFIRFWGKGKSESWCNVFVQFIGKVTSVTCPYEGYAATGASGFALLRQLGTLHEAGKHRVALIRRDLFPSNLFRHTLYREGPWSGWRLQSVLCSTA